MDFELLEIIRVRGLLVLETVGHLCAVVSTGSPEVYWDGGAESVNHQEAEESGCGMSKLETVG